jgi:hypothetical protein
MLQSAFERIVAPEGLEDSEGANPAAAEAVPGDEAARSERERSLRRAVFRARDLVAEAPSVPVEGDQLSCCIPAADRLLDGGLQRGEVVEVVGRRSSGRFSLVLSLLAAATRAGEAVALVDLGDQLDPQLAEAAGVALERLLWLRPQRLKEALGAAELLLQTDFVLVALDLGQPPVPGGRGVETFWVRLGRAARDHRGALLVSAPYRTSGSIAQAVLELRGAGATWLGRGSAPRLLGGFEALIERTRARGRLRDAAGPIAGGFALRPLEAETVVATPERTASREEIGREEVGQSGVGQLGRLRRLGQLRHDRHDRHDRQVGLAVAGG